MGIGESISRLNDKYCVETVKSRPVEFKGIGLSQKAKQKSLTLCLLNVKNLRVYALLGSS